MKTGFCISIIVLIWISSSSSYVLRCPQETARKDCRKSYEMPRTPINYIICGNSIVPTIMHLCGFRVKRRAPEDVLLGRQSANQFLSAHHRSKRSFNPVEECCNEGCKLEELREYCGPY